MNKTPSSVCNIRFNDCDMFGHLNNARYIDYMVNARQDHLKEAYNFDLMGYYKNNLGWVISQHEITYIKPAFFDEDVLIQSALLNADADALYVEVLMMNKNKTQLKAALRSKLTFINIKTGKRGQHSPEFMEWAKTLLVEERIYQMGLSERVKQLLVELKSSHS